MPRLATGFFFNTMQWWEVCSDMAFQTTLGQEEGAATLGEATLGQHLGQRRR